MSIGRSTEKAFSLRRVCLVELEYHIQACWKGDDQSLPLQRVGGSKELSSNNRARMRLRFTTGFFRPIILLGNGGGLFYPPLLRNRRYHLSMYFDFRTDATAD